MSEEFPIKLGFFIEVIQLEGISGVPEGVEAGYVVNGLKMPDGIVGYAIERDSSMPDFIRVVACIGTHGQAWACDDVVDCIPAGNSCLAMYQSNPGENPHEIAIDVSDEAGLRACVARASCDNIDDASKSRFANIVIYEGEEPVPLEGDLDYCNMMAMLFFRCSRYASPGVAKAHSAVFDYQAVLERLASSDVFDAVNREVLEFENAVSEGLSACALERYLVHGLRESGLPGKTVNDFVDEGGQTKLAARLIRTLRYAGTYYVDYAFENADGRLDDGAFLSDDAALAARRALLRAESSLNMFLLVLGFLDSSEYEDFSASMQQIAEINECFIDGICLQAPDPSNPLDAKGRWQTCLNFSRQGESWRLPYRVPYEFCLDTAGETLGIELAMPETYWMAQSSWSQNDNAFVAREPENLAHVETKYALHACILAAACGFHSSCRVRCVQVNIVRPSSADVVFSASFDRSAFQSAFTACEDGRLDDPIAFMLNFHASMSLDELGALCPVDATFEFGKGAFEACFEHDISLDRTRFNHAAQHIFDVKSPSQMTIFEGAVRSHYAQLVCKALDSGVDAAACKLKDIRDSDESLLVRGVCDSLSNALATGELNCDSYLEVREAFEDVYGLKGPLQRASKLIRDGSPECIEILEGIVQNENLQNRFRDSSIAVWRYFGGFEERVVYAMRCADDCDGRRVEPLPDEYFAAFDVLCQQYTNSIADVPRALELAHRCVSMAPARALSYLRLARVHFVLENFEDEIEQCKTALHYSLNNEDTSLALYWLAYAYWRTGKYDVAVACYKRVCELGGSMATEAKGELDRLLASVRGLRRRSPEQEDQLLRDEGIEHLMFLHNAKFIMNAAEESINSNCLALGCVLGVSGANTLRDDAAYPAIRANSRMVR